jgi:hypothetical protein
MPCPCCRSNNEGSFPAEIAVHFPGIEGLDKPIVWVFPKLLLCLDCGFTQFVTPEEPLRQLREGVAQLKKPPASPVLELRQLNHADHGWHSPS